DVGVLHLVVEVVPFTGTLAHAGEHGQTAVRLGDVVDQFHHVHGLADTGTTEQAHLAALGERADQVDHLDAGFQPLIAAGLVGVPLPAGTEMASPVLTTSRPRLRPAVEPMAMERTMPSPSCCWTSRVVAAPCTFSAS